MALRLYYAPRHCLNQWWGWLPREHFVTGGAFVNCRPLSLSPAPCQVRLGRKSNAANLMSTPLMSRTRTAAPRHQRHGTLIFETSQIYLIKFVIFLTKRHSKYYRQLCLGFNVCCKPTWKEIIKHISPNIELMFENWQWEKWVSMGGGGPATSRDNDAEKIPRYHRASHRDDTRASKSEP